MLALELRLHSKPFLFIVVYLVPGTSSLEFYNEFSEKFLALALDYEEVICLGDFNLHFNTRNKFANLILEVFQTIELSARVHEPTHKHGNTLDQVFLPTFYESCPMIVQQLDFSDHFLIEFDMPVSDKPKHRNRPFTCRNFKRVPWKNVFEKIEKSSAITLRTSDDPNTLCKWFLDIIRSYVDFYAPPTQRKGFHKKCPFLDDDLIASKKNKRKKKRGFRKQRTKGAQSDLSNAMLEYQNLCYRKQEVVS